MGGRGVITWRKTGQKKTKKQKQKGYQCPAEARYLILHPLASAVSQKLDFLLNEEQMIECLYQILSLVASNGQKMRYQRARNNYERSMYKSQVGHLCILAKETGKPARQRLSSLVRSCSSLT